jgi:heat shock protein 4
MSVVGIDFGSRNCTIAIAQRGGIDVIANEVSNRQTPTMIAFGEKERYIGEPALTQWMRYLKSTVTDVKRILGKKYSEKDVEIESKRAAYKMVEQDGKLAVQVMYCNEQQVFTTEALVAMILGKLKITAEAATQAKVHDVVISVPAWWTDAQRKALLDATQIAGLNCLRLINDTAAAALGYGIYKTDLPEKEKDPVRVLFVDIGETSTDISAVAFHKGQLKVLGTAHDRHLGGRDFDEVLVQHFAKEFQTKYKIDVNSNPKALIRLRVQCEKVKKILSANAEAPLNIDNLMNDIDVRAMIDRKTFEALSAELLERLAIPLKRVLEETGIQPEQFSSIELIGGGSRLLSAQKKISEVLKRDPSRTLNSEEAVARGAALQCAMLSPVFKVRDFAVNDITKFPIRLSWKSITDGVATEGSDVVFKANSSIPNPKMITFPRSESLEITADYQEHPELPSDHPTVVAKYTVANPRPASSDPANIKVKVKLDIHGIFSVENAQLVEVLPEDPTATPMETDKPEGEAEKKDEKADEKKDEKKRKTKRTDLTITGRGAGLTAKELQHTQEEELRMVAADTLAIETAEAKNSLESYIYNTRSKLQDSLVPFSTEEERTPLLKMLDEAENWLYGDGEDVTKSVYAEKLASLQKHGDPIALRGKEAELRPEAINALVDAIAHWQGELSTTSDKYDHIDKADKDKISAELDNARTWLVASRAKQDALPQTANPVLLTADLIARKNNLEKLAKPILSRPKPKPKPAEAPKPAETPKPAEPTPSTPSETPSSDSSSQQSQQAQPEVSTPKPDSSMEVD